MLATMMKISHLSKLFRKFGSELANKIKEVSIRYIKRLTKYAITKGIIIADTKFEFGLDDDGQLVLMDEVLTADSSRFWPSNSYVVGENPPSYDKQFVRDWLEQVQINGKPWDKRPPAPKLPEAVILKTAQKYQEALEVLTQ
jgi:phosphoribosylaminoimidazole-succinocarboxamide synthase